MTVEIITNHVADTMAVGRRLAALTRPGDVIALSGPLGAGKTAFVGGLAEGLGITDPVTSPSFVIMKRYDEGFIPLIHVDVYRLGSLAEFEDLGVVDESADGIAIIEWGNAVAPALPENVLAVTISVGDNEERLLQFHPEGNWTSRPLSELSA